MDKVKIAIAGCGNCAQALYFGAHHYRFRGGPAGLISRSIGNYGPGSVEIVAAFDVDFDKVGNPLSGALLSGQNVREPEFSMPAESWDPIEFPDPVVSAAPRLDGVGRSLSRRIDGVTEGTYEGVVEELRRSGAEVLVNFIPVGSAEATEMYARAALEAGCAFVNGIPVPLAREKHWAEAFLNETLPLIGDDCKSQLGATYTHRALVNAFEERGVAITGTYQMNAGGNSDFINMQDEERLEEKRVSKRQSIQDVTSADLSGSFIGPAGVIPYLGDKKLALIEVVGEGFAGNRIEVQARFSGLDSPGAAAVVYDAVRWCRLAMDHGVCGVLEAPSAFLMKAPPSGIPDAAALESCRFFEHSLLLSEDEAIDRTVR